MPPGIARTRSSMGRASYRVGRGRRERNGRRRDRPGRYGTSAGLDTVRTCLRPKPVCGMRSLRVSSGVRWSQRIHRPRIGDVAREAGVSKTAVSFAFNSPDRLAPETAIRIREVAEQLGYHAAPGRPDARPSGETHDDRRPDAAGARGRLLEPVLRCLHRGRRPGGRGAGLRACTSSRRCAAVLARALSRATVDGVVAIGLSDDHPEVEQIRRAGMPDRAGRLDRAARARFGRDRRRRRRAGGGGAPPRPGPSRRAGHRRRAADARRDLDPDGVTARRLRGYREAFAAVGADDRRTSDVVVGPASIDGGIAVFAPRLG